MYHDNISTTITCNMNTYNEFKIMHSYGEQTKEHKNAN